MVKWDRWRSAEHTGYNRIKWERGRFLLTGPADRSSVDQVAGTECRGSVTSRESASWLARCSIRSGRRHSRAWNERRSPWWRIAVNHQVTEVGVVCRDDDNDDRSEEELFAEVTAGESVAGGGAFMSARRGRPTSTISGCFRHADGNLAVPPFKWSWGVATCRRSASPWNSCAGNYSSWARESSTSRGRNRATWH